MGNSSRDEILKRIRIGLRHKAEASEATIPAGEKLARETVKRETLRRHEELKGRKQAVVNRFVEEITNIRGISKVIPSEGEIKEFIGSLIKGRGVRCVAMWESDFLRRINLSGFLQSEGLQFASPESGGEMANADIGITEADFAVAETGTIVLMTNKKQPRSVSLIPPIHIAVVNSEVIVEKIYDLFLILENSLPESGSILDLTNCMTFITGPSRTADIELTLTLGVHGPREVFVLVYSQSP